MPNQLWAQDKFTVGELSPLMYARASQEQYYDALYTAQNVLILAQGGAAKRFGTYYRATLNSFTNYNQFFFQIFPYLNESVYQLLFTPTLIQIFLEGIQIATVTTTLNLQQIQSLAYTVLDNKFRVSGNFKPYDLIRSASSANVITAAGTNLFTLTTTITAGLVLPIQFTNSGGALPTTTPQIQVGVTYFAYNVDTSHIAVYPTSQDAANQNQATQFVLTNAGTGTNSVVPQNTWSFANVTFRNTPVFDFTGGYDSYTFTLGSTSGSSVTLTASGGSPFTTAHVGGAFIGLGGVARITAYSSGTVVTVAISQTFSAAIVAGTLALLTEPAWSDTRGWPTLCSSFQNRAIFANSPSLQNGVWLSVINDYYNFDDTNTDDDNAISWYPSSDNVNFITYVVPYRSLTVHTNTGVYSSPLAATSAITPQNFALNLNETTPPTNIQPRALDNQIFVVSGNDVYSLIWDGINNAYTSEIISLMNEQIIRNPIDEAAFINLSRGGSRYLFIINTSGSMGVYQSLLTENVKGWTACVTEQSYGNSYFRAVATSPTGRSWFITERQIAASGSTFTIDNYTSNTLHTSTNNDFTSTPIAVIFDTSGGGILPTSSPQIEDATYYFVIGLDNRNFEVYASYSDALAGINNFTFENAGTATVTVTEWPLSTQFFLEELTFDTFLDCATYYSGTPILAVTGVPRFNAQQVAMVGDGYGFNAVGEDDAVIFTAHGQPVLVSQAYVGFPINTIIEPMPLAISLSASPRNTTLTRPKHVRSINFMFNDTIGGFINGVPIALQKFNDVPIGEPPIPSRGTFQMGIMNGWDDSLSPNFTITHNDPFDIQLLGIFYSVDT